MGQDKHAQRFVRVKASQFMDEDVTDVACGTGYQDHWRITFFKPGPDESLMAQSGQMVMNQSVFYLIF